MSTPRPAASAANTPDQARRRRGFLLGPSKEGTGFWSPMPQLSAPWEDTEISNEAQRISRALADNGPMSRSDLRERVGGRFWGPRRFSHALQHALQQGVIRSTGHDTYAVPD